MGHNLTLPSRVLTPRLRIPLPIALMVGRIKPLQQQVQVQPLHFLCLLLLLELTSIRFRVSMWVPVLIRLLYKQLPLLLVATSRLLLLLLVLTVMVRVFLRFLLLLLIALLELGRQRLIMSQQLLRLQPTIPLRQLLVLVSVQRRLPCRLW